MRKFNLALTKIVAFTVCASMSLGLIADTVYAVPENKKKDDTAANPVIEVEYQTGTQNNAKDRRDDKEATKSENDGSYEVIIPGISTSLDENGEIIVEDNAEAAADGQTGDSGEEQEIVWEDVHISTPEEFSEFARKCRLDTWSQNKNVYLDADITISGAKNSFVPTFGGHFYGQGHEINGYMNNEARSYTGLFAYTQSTAVIEDLTVKASVRVQGKQIVTGGIVGENRGEIRNCTFDGTVTGENYVGGITGYNELTGNIISCRSKGVINGCYYTGGIAGENVGNISSCINEAQINTTLVERTTSVQDIDLSEYTDQIVSKVTGQAEEKDAKANSNSGPVDMGGIAGVSIGVIQFSDNKGNVGYEHVGYNVGGIVGRQSGYVHGCINNGHVLGRKDVGGIVGQAEPYVVVDLTEDTIQKLSDNIDELHDIISNTLNDAGDSSDTITSRLNIVKEFTDKALNETSFLSDATITWTNGMVGAGNEAMSRAQYIMSETSKSDGPMENGSEAFDDTKVAAGQLQDTVNDLDIYRYMSDSQKATYDKAKERFNFLSKEYTDDEEKYSKAAENYYIYKLRNDKDLLDQYKYKDDYDDDNNIFKLHAYKKDGDTETEITEISSWTDLDANIDNWKTVSYWKHGDGDSFGSKDSDKTLAKDAGTEADSYVDNKVCDAYNAKYGESISDAKQEMASYGVEMASIIAAITPAMDEATRKDATKASESLKNASEHLSNAGTQTKDIFKSVANKGGITMPSLGDDYRNSTQLLNAALQGMSDNMGALNNEMADSSDVMIDDMGKVNDQFNVIMKLYADAIDGVVDGDYEDTVEDTSMEEAKTCVDATIADCENTGRIEGDIDVSGICGAMGIEYDFDLESDITKSDDAKLTSTYQSKCVLRQNKNNARVTGQKSCVGGICGLQEMGTVLQCENYGKVESTTSEYVGGIAGDSLSYIQKSYSKCVLSGNRYVGGIAGHGTNILNSYSLVSIDEDTADAYYGAIAGDVKDDGKIHYNYFVSDTLAGIDRINYSGGAEPLSYNTFASMEGMPKDCQVLYARFYIEDEEVGCLSTVYGGTITADQFPEYLKEDGTYAKWDKGDLENMTCDEEVTAEYTRYLTSIASEQMRSNDQSAILVDGVFVEGDTVECESLPITGLPMDNVVEHWGVTYRSDPNEEHLIRFKNPDNIETDSDIYINNAGKWTKVKTEMFGNCKTFSVPGGHVEFAVVRQPKSYLKQIIIAAAAIALIIILLIIIRISVKKKRRNKKNNNSSRDKKEIETGEEDRKKDGKIDGKKEDARKTDKVSDEKSGNDNKGDDDIEIVEI